MDWDSCAELENLNKALDWFHKFQECRGEPLTSWVSKFHQSRLPCRLANEAIAQEKRGSFNWTCQVVFTNGESWMARFPIDGKVKNADEKVEIEVATMSIVRKHTNIPVPEIKAWGRAADNELGLGPFIITPFVEGVSLADFLRDPHDAESRVMRKDVADADLQVIFKQIAQFMIQLAKLNFNRIGSPSIESLVTNGEFTTAISSRPMTWKAHEILNVGGVDVFGPRRQTFSTAGEYLQHVAEQDWQHLHEQLNSIDDEEDARLKYRFWSVFKALVPRFVAPDSNSGPFKLICDDFGPANMMVNKTNKLKIIAVLDWEWSYAGPYQLFCCPPRWLIIDRPNQWAEQDERLQRYDKYLDMFIAALEQVEIDLSQDSIATVEERLSTRMRTQREGQMWFHHIILEGFNGPTYVPFQKLRAAVPNFDDLAAKVPGEDVDDFVSMKLRHLIAYKQSLDAYGDAINVLK